MLSRGLHERGDKYLDARKYPSSNSTTTTPKASKCKPPNHGFAYQLRPGPKLIQIATRPTTTKNPKAACRTRMRAGKHAADLRGSYRGRVVCGSRLSRIGSGSVRHPMQRKNSLDQSARKLLIHMGIAPGPCGLRPHTEQRGRRGNRPVESETGPGRCRGGTRRSPQASARTRDNTRLLALSDEKKPQPREVGAYGLVELGGIEPPSASHRQADLHA
jgi:hypothetical protein